jgi:amino acid adenylation domain-containing protein
VRIPALDKGLGPTVSDVLHGIIKQALDGPDPTAIKDQDRALSYGELIDEVAQLATGLANSGVVEGDRVALLLPNSIDFVVAALASLWIGAIFVPLAVTDPEARLEVMLVDCDPAVIIISDAEEEWQGHTFQGVGNPTRAIASLLESTQDRVAPVEESARPVYLMYTSGTTGTPKGVLIGSTAFDAAVRSTSEALSLGRHTRTLCVSPFYFDGSFATLFPTLFSGGTVVIRPYSLLFSRTFFDTVVREGITYTGFSPSFLRLLLASPQMSKLAGSTLDVIALGGEASSVVDIRALQVIAPQIRVFNRYGPTETTIVVTHLHLTPEIIAEGQAPIGVAHPSVTFYLLSGDGAVIAEPDEVGELYIGGVQLMDGYWGAPALTKDVLRTDVVPGENVYRTGDLVYRRGDGNYVYVDRADNVINRHGVRISLVELSETMRGLDDVSAAACLIFDDEGEVGIVAFVVTEGSVTVPDLRRAALGRLPEAMVPNRIEVVDVLPVNKSNKLDERRLLSEANLRSPSHSSGPGRASQSEIE